MEKDRDKEKEKDREEKLHPLEHKWTFWFDKLQSLKKTKQHVGPAYIDAYESNLREVGTFQTVEHFWRYFNHMQRASSLEHSANYHLFKCGIKPMWEDSQNAGGGKWQIRLKREEVCLDGYWQNLALALIGETADEGNEICGAVMSRRRGGDRLAIWVRQKDDKEAILKLGRKIRDLIIEDVNADADFTMEYTLHEDSQKTGTSQGTVVHRLP